LKALSFIIHSNILIAFAALSLALSTQVQLGLKPEANAYLAVIFFAALLDYNFHRFKAVNNKPEAFRTEKLKWAAEHHTHLKTLLFASFTGLVISMLFVRIEVLFVLIPLAILSILYSFSFPGKQKHHSHLLKITGMKTLMIAFVWSSATVFAPALQEGQSFGYQQIALLFAERFTFIFAIAIPFDIRDVETDKISSLRTIPVHFGENNALKISNIALLLSLSFAAFHYFYSNLIFILPAYSLSIILSLMFINNKPLKNAAFYYHGILDGCILLHGILISLSFYLTL
jgi:4-hydroxybenzoate polyprenyltransferase